MTDSMSMTDLTNPKLIVPEFTTSKITNVKLNGDNYLKWRKITEINLIGHENKSYLYMDPPISKMDKWELEDAALFGQLLNIRKQKNIRFDDA